MHEHWVAVWRYCDVVAVLYVRKLTVHALCNAKRACKNPWWIGQASSMPLPTDDIKQTNSTEHRMSAAQNTFIKLSRQIFCFFTISFFFTFVHQFTTRTCTKQTKHKPNIVRWMYAECNTEINCFTIGNCSLNDGFFHFQWQTMGILVVCRFYCHSNISMRKIIILPLGNNTLQFQYSTIYRQETTKWREKCQEFWCGAQSHHHNQSHIYFSIIVFPFVTRKWPRARTMKWTICIENWLDDGD